MSKDIHNDSMGCNKGCCASKSINNVRLNLPSTNANKGLTEFILQATEDPIILPPGIQPPIVDPTPPDLNPIFETLTVTSLLTSLGDALFNTLRITGKLDATNCANMVAADRLTFNCDVFVNGPTGPVGPGGVLYYDGNNIRGVTDIANAGDQLVFNGVEVVWANPVSAFVNCAYITTDTTVGVNSYNIVDSSLGPIEITFPVNPPDGVIIIIKAIDTTNPIMVTPSVTDPVEIPTDPGVLTAVGSIIEYVVGESYIWRYCVATPTPGWYIDSDFNPNLQPKTICRSIATTSTLNRNSLNIVDTSLGPVTLTFPENPIDSDLVILKITDITNTITISIDTVTEPIEIPHDKGNFSTTTFFLFAVRSKAYTWKYCADTGIEGWYVISDFTAEQDCQTISVSPATAINPNTIHLIDTSVGAITVIFPSATTGYPAGNGFLITLRIIDSTNPTIVTATAGSVVEDINAPGSFVGSFVIAAGSAGKSYIWQYCDSIPMVVSPGWVLIADYTTTVGSGAPLLISDGGLTITGQTVAGQYNPADPLNATISTDLNTVYQNGPVGNTVLMNAVDGEILLRDNAATIGRLFAIEDNTSTEFYLDIHSSYFAGLKAVTPSASSNSIAIGDMATTSGGANSIALGTSATAIASSVAIGDSPTASGICTIAIGDTATAAMTNATAVGCNATASGLRSTAYGNASNASGTESIAIGDVSSATETCAISIGDAAMATMANATAVGCAAVASGLRSSAYGNTATASALESIAIGDGATASGAQSIAIGDVPIAAATCTISIGDAAMATMANATAVGCAAVASGLRSSAYGNTATASALESIAIGDGATASGAQSIAIGDVPIAAATGSISIGDGSIASAINSIAIGTTAFTANSIVIGAFASRPAAPSSFGRDVVIGQSATKTGGNASGDISIGESASSNSAGGGVVIGSFASMTSGSSFCTQVGGATMISDSSEGTIIGYGSTITGGSSAVIAGSASSVSGIFTPNAIIIGDSSIVTAAYSTAIGTANTISAVNSAIFSPTGSVITNSSANCMVLSTLDMPQTFATQSSILMKVFPVGERFATNANAAGPDFTRANHFRWGANEVKTTTGNVAASAFTNTFPLATSFSVLMKIYLNGSRTGGVGTVGDTWVYEYFVKATNVAGVVIDPLTTITKNEVPGESLNVGDPLTFTAAAGAIAIAVTTTGLDPTDTIQWVLVIEAVYNKFA